MSDANELITAFRDFQRRDDMGRMYDIIRDLENDYGIDLAEDDIPDVLCDGPTCRHSECDCWSVFRKEVDDTLLAQAVGTPKRYFRQTEEEQHARTARMLNKSHLREAA